MTTLAHPLTSHGDPADAEHDRALFKALCHAARVAIDYFAYDHALRITQALRALRPHEQSLIFAQAQLLWSANRIHEADDLLRGLDHPHAKAIQALCAAAMNRVDAPELAREAHASGDEFAVMLANLTLEAPPAPDHYAALESAT